MKRQTLLFSATLSKEIETLTHEFLRTPKTVQIGRRSNPADTVTQLIYEVPKPLKPALLAHLLKDASLDSVLVFTRTKHGADRVARKLESCGITTATLHSNRSQNQRLRALASFRSGAVRVLVATDIAARGIDVTGISHVVNYDFPMHSEDYVHRIGRTGRAKCSGRRDQLRLAGRSQRGARARALHRTRVVRKRAEGFDYAAPANRSEEAASERRFAPPGRRPPMRGEGGGNGPREGNRGGQRRGGGRRF